MRPLSPRAQYERRFAEWVLPHLDAAYNLARWLLRDDYDAEDVTQEAMLRAFRFFEGFRGDAAQTKAWLLAIVRNRCYTWLRARNAQRGDSSFDEQTHSLTADTVDGGATPETLCVQAARREWVQECLNDMPVEFREVVVLRELEEMSYKEIAAVVDIPIGTVMSRLARGRDVLARALARRWAQENER